MKGSGDEGGRVRRRSEGEGERERERMRVRVGQGEGNRCELTWACICKRGTDMHRGR